MKSPKRGVRRLVRLFGLMGVKVQLGDETLFSKNGYGRWTSQIYLDVKDVGDQSAEWVVARDIAHEIGHFLVAPPGRRFRKDFGIPTKSTRTDTAQIEEDKAMVVQNHLLIDAGFKGLKDPIRHSVTPAYRAEVKKWWNSEGKNKVDTILELL